MFLFLLFLIVDWMKLFELCCLMTYKICYEVKVHIQHVVENMVICLSQEVREKLQCYLFIAFLKQFGYMSKTQIGLFPKEPTSFPNGYLSRNWIAARTQHLYLAGFLLQTQLVYPPTKQYKPLTWYSMGFKNSESGNSLKKDNFKKLDTSGSLNLRKKKNPIQTKQIGIL